MEPLDTSTAAHVIRRPATNQTDDIDGARPKPLRPFAQRILSRHPNQFVDPLQPHHAITSSSAIVAATGARPGSPLRCVDPTTPVYSLGWVTNAAAERRRKEGKAAGTYRPQSAGVARAPTDDPWRIDKLNVDDIVGKPTRPRSADVRHRETGNRSLDYSDIPRSTSAQNAGRQLNFTQRKSNFLLETGDIRGARPRSPSPEARPRDPQSPRYYYDTRSMVGTVVKMEAEDGRSLADNYGAFEKRGKERLRAALASQREERNHGAGRPPSSLQTSVERPPEHPNSQDAAHRRFREKGIIRRDDIPEDFAANAMPGKTRASHTTFAHEAVGGRGTNPSDPTYMFDLRNKPVAPQRRRPHSAGPCRPSTLNERVVAGGAAARRLQEEIAAVRNLPSW